MKEGSGSMDDDLMTVRGDPDKTFFLDNLIKDIELIPAILDLADNSVDSARQLAIESLIREGSESETVQVDLPDGAFDGLEVRLTVKPEQFVIEDTCAGISIPVARNYAFRIGRSKDWEGVAGSVGQFGVGMKRALFKMGRRFRVQSRTDTDGFVLDVDVDSWIKDQDEQDWTFKFDSVDPVLSPPAPGERGTRIEVSRLHKTVVDDFGDDLVISLIREQLRLRHQEALDRGLSILLNGEKLIGLKPELMSGQDLGAIRRSFVVDSTEGTVAVEIIAGIVKTNRRELNVDDNRAENFKAGNEAGWWVFGNNRLLLVADKSPETGWGRGSAAYHPQYRLFRGYVYMSSLETSLLPWNTTKTGVDADSLVWREVQSEMTSVLVEVQAVLNRIKTERESELDDDLDSDPGDFPYLRALAQATSTPIRELKPSDTIRVPSIPVKRLRRPKVLKRLQYDVPTEQADLAMRVLEFSTLAELGRRSFDYFYKREVESQ